MRRLFIYRGYRLIGFIIGLVIQVSLATPLLSQGMAPFEKIKKVEELSYRSLEIMSKAPETEKKNQIRQEREAIVFSSQALDLAAEVVSEAQKTKNTALAQQLLDMLDKVREPITQILTTARNISQTSKDSTLVTEAANIIRITREMLKRNEDLVSMAVATGATRTPKAYRPAERPRFVPLPVEPPIQDTEPASKV
jgi:hypothetical protein